MAKTRFATDGLRTSINESIKRENIVPMFGTEPPMLEESSPRKSDVQVETDRSM